MNTVYTTLTAQHGRTATVRAAVLGARADRGGLCAAQGAATKGNVGNPWFTLPIATQAKFQKPAAKPNVVPQHTQHPSFPPTSWEPSASD